MHYDELVFVVGVGVGVDVAVGVADDVVVDVAVGVVVDVAVGVVVELDDEADTLWSVNCQRPNAMTPMITAAARRNPYFCLTGLFVTLRAIIGVLGGGMPPDSIVISPCGCAIHPSTIVLRAVSLVRVHQRLYPFL